MTGRTLTRADLSEAVYQEVGLSRHESAQLVESILKQMSDALAAGATVKISSFGSFSVRQKGQRVGRNPKTGAVVTILPRRVLVFRASHVLKNQINASSSPISGLSAGGISRPCSSIGRTHLIAGASIARGMPRHFRQI